LDVEESNRSRYDDKIDQDFRISDKGIDNRARYLNTLRLVKLGPSVIIVEILVHVVHRYCNMYRTPPVP
jgi:hypothetical protein